MMVPRENLKLLKLSLLTETILWRPEAGNSTSKMKDSPGMLMKTKDRFSALRGYPGMCNKNKGLNKSIRECY